MTALEPTSAEVSGSISRRDLALGSAALLVAMLLSIGVTDSWVVFTRPFWLDEYHTIFIASEPTIGEIVSDLRRAADFNPPLLYLMLHGIGKLTGGLTPTNVRVFSFVTAWLAAVTVYAILRPRRGIATAFGAALLLWTSPLVVSQAFQGRFYGPWLLLAVAYAAALKGKSSQRASPMRLTWIALLAASLCTIHYFGIITWSLVGLALLPIVSLTTDPLRRFLASLAGPFGLAVVMPLYFGQREAMSTVTWVPPISLNQIYELLTYMVAWPAVLGLMLVYVFLSGWRRPPDARRGELEVAYWSPIEVALFCLIGHVVFLIVFSAMIQPVGVSRFGIPAVLAWVPIAVLALERVNRIVRYLIVVAIWAFSAVIVRHQGREQAEFEARLVTDAAELARIGASGLPLVATDRFALYPLAHSDPLAGVSLSLVDLNDSDSAATRDSAGRPPRLTASDLHERTNARVHAGIYGFPILVSSDSLASREAFVLFGERGVGVFAARWFPDHERRRINDRIYELRRIRP